MTITIDLPDDLIEYATKRAIGMDYRKGNLSDAVDTSPPRSRPAEPAGSAGRVLRVRRAAAQKRKGRPMNVTITIAVEHSIALETLSALESLIRAALPLLEPGARPPDGNVAHIETPEHAAPETSEHVVYPVRDPGLQALDEATSRAEMKVAESPSNLACSVCGNPIAQSNESGVCRSCSMKQARAKRPARYHGPRLPRAPRTREQRQCADCGENITHRNKSGLCRLCNIRHNRINPTKRALKDIIREPAPIKPFCAHDRDPDTCIHCAKMRESGMDTARPRRNDKADMNPGRKPRRLFDPPLRNEDLDALYHEVPLGERARMEKPRG